jgi:hypothetical protein
MSYLRFMPGVPSATGRTKSWSVSSNGYDLGTVRWYAPFRRYCFFPKSDTVFDASCLSELQVFVLEETMKHMKK